MQIKRRFSGASLSSWNFSHGRKKNAGITFYTNVVDLGIAKGVFQQEFPFAHPDLNVDWLLVAKYRVSTAQAVSFLIT